MTVVGSATLELLGDTSDFQRSIALAGEQLRGMADDMVDVGRTLTTRVSVPLVAAGGLATKFAIDFQRGLANVATLMPNSTERVQELGRAVQDLATQTGQSTSDLTGGLYQVVSAFGDSADTARVLEINARAAAAGMSTVTESIDLTSAVTKAYGDTSAAAVAQSADLGILAVRLGQTTFPELAGAVGRVTPLTAELGVSVEELFGTMATFTGVTGRASEVSTQLRGVLQSLMTPTGDMEDAFASLGVESGKALIEQRGLQGAIAAIVALAAESGVPLQKFIQSIEGQTLALAASNGQSDVYTEKLAAMLDANGAAAEAFRELEEGIGGQTMALEKAQQEMVVAGQIIGSVILPPLAALASVVASVVGVLEHVPGPVLNVVVGLTALVVAIGPLLMAIGKLIKFWPLVVAGAKAVGAGLAFLLGPVGWVAAAVVGLTAVWVIWGDDIKRIVAETFTAITGWFGERFNAAVERVGAGVERVKNFFRDMYMAVVGGSYVPDMIDGIALEFQRLDEVMVSPTERATAFAERSFSRLADGIADWATGSTNSIRAAVNAIISDIARMVARLLIARALLAAFPGSGIVASVAGSLMGRANGGPVRGNTPYMVGERGPELFVPSGAGSIVSNAGMAGGGTIRIDMGGLPPRPTAMTPDAVATDDWWRRAFSSLKLDYDDRGGL